MVLNVAPIGCYPAFLAQLPHESNDLDSYGCMSSYNNAVNEYNSQLKGAIQQAQKELYDAKVVYVDTSSAVLDLFQNPSSHGPASYTPLHFFIRTSNIVLKLGRLT